MFKRDLISANTSEKRPVSFLEDDSIETVRKQISKSVDVHHDRLFVLVAISCDRHYYLKDPRRWEALFERISLNGKPIEKELFDEYLNTYRVPKIDVPYQKYDKNEWMLFPEELRDIFEPSGDFIEYRILGVDENKSYCLPLKFNMFLSSKIQSSQLPIPQNTELLKSLHSVNKIKGFLFKEHETDISGAYFPLIRSTTPLKLREEDIARLDNTSKNIVNLLELDCPSPKKVHFLKLSWFVELIDTDFGESVRNRFEQIFYGLTVSEDVPCITFFTGRTDVSRHKFYTGDVKTKKPHLDLAMWASWWTKSKPPRNRPTLVLYRGTSRESYDRISISSSDISFVAYRCLKNNETIEKTRDSIFKWYSKFDAIVPFIKTSDLEFERVKLQEIRYEATYADILEELDTRRINCLSDIFSELKTHKTAFRFLRTDFANENTSLTDIRILELLNDNPFIRPDELQIELNVSREEATKLLNDMVERIKEEPWLLNKKQRGFPIFEFRSSGVIANFIKDFDNSLKYLNILQYILSNPSSKVLDKVCPKRVESVDAVVSTINTNITTEDEFEDLFEFIEEAEEQPKNKVNQVFAKTKNTTTYGYFQSRLQDFDPDTFSQEAFPEYPKKCEQGHQPIILSKNELEKIPEEYNPKSNVPANKKIEVSSPDGLMVCPEYWCMYDKIPLEKSQLVKVDGKDACPICNGKVQTLKDKQKDSREYSVIQKTKGYNYPGLMKHLSKKNQKELPCCYKKPTNTKKLSVDEKDQKYYILGETKTPLEELRFAYVPKQVLDALGLDEDYAIVKDSHDRIQSGLSGFFRVGLGRASKTFPMFVKKDLVNPPIQELKNVLACSFVSSWMFPDDLNSEEIDESLKGILLFKNDDLARKKISRIISGINTAFIKGTLTPAQEIEYSAIVLKIDLYRIVLDDMSVRCTFDIAKFKKQNGIVLLEYNGEIDCLCHVLRKQRNFEYRADIFNKPFPEPLQKYIAEDSVYKSCEVEHPEMITAFDIIKDSPKIFDDFPDFSIVLDPYGKSFALYSPDNFILPFKSTPTPPTKPGIKFVSGLSETRNNLPTYEGMKTLIDKILKANTHSGYKLYEIARELHDSFGNIVELETVTGLRIPIKPVPSEGKDEEVTETVNDESQLVFGEENEEDTYKYKNISYNSEIYDFLIFQLTNDLQKEDFEKLKLSIMNLPASRNETEKEVEKWFHDTTFFANVTEPIKFLSKIRKPCGQLKNCESGNMCGVDKNQCKIKIRDTVSKEKLLNKIIATLLDNKKARYIILDGKTTPFFSTILYIELPTEIILTDAEIKKEV